MRRGVGLIGGAALLALAAAGAARADVVHLTNGRVIEGEAERTEEGWRVSLRHGSVLVPVEQVERVEEVAPPPAPRQVAPDELAPPAPRRATVARAAPATTRLVVAARAPTPAEAAADAEVRRRAEEVGVALRTRQVERARELVAEDPRLLSWEETTVRCAFDGRGLELTVERPAGQEGPLAVAFDPGTYGTPRDRYSQDLVLLRAPVVVLGSVEDRVTARVPIACSSYGVPSPQREQVYLLRRAERGSSLERLLIELCAGPEPTPEAETQLAVWCVANRLERDAFRSGYTTFASSEWIRAEHAGGARQLIEAAGLDAGALPFFGGEAHPDAPSADASPDAEPATPPAPRPAPPAPRPRVRVSS